MPLYRKRPITVEARQWTRDVFFEEFEEWGYGAIRLHSADVTMLVVQTLEGPVHAREGDYIIRGVAGEFYPCKPDIFAATYEPAETPAVPTPAPETEPASGNSNDDAPFQTRHESEGLAKTLMPPEGEP